MLEAVEVHHIQQVVLVALEAQVAVVQVQLQEGQLVVLVL
jgi:hypothetical protein